MYNDSDVNGKLMDAPFIYQELKPSQLEEVPMPTTIAPRDVNQLSSFNQESTEPELDSFEQWIEDNVFPYERNDLGF